jgi:4-alpha-glucanotransferase
MWKVRMSFQRSGGVLLHPTSLPGKYGIGELGKEAYQFVDFLIESGQKLWQVFPLGPTGYGDSPYQCFSAFAGNHILISLDELSKKGWLSVDDLESATALNTGSVDFGPVIIKKSELLNKAYDTYKSKGAEIDKCKMEVFRKNNGWWLEDYALFMALKEHFKMAPWNEWPPEIRVRAHDALMHYRYELADRINFQVFLQHIFFAEWHKLKAYANRNYIKIIGDIPIFVAFDSAEAWSSPEMFQFDHERRPISVAGVPPDIFSATGQLWGNPLYNWDHHEERGFDWWISRIKANIEMVDILRIDHFVGFTHYYAIPAKDRTAQNGKWVKAPGMKLFKAVKDALGVLPIIAEDLGNVTKEVTDMREHFGFPGMNILQFCFGDAEEDKRFIPHRYSRNSVVYIGTHDNDTVVSWYNGLPDFMKERVCNYANTNGSEINWVMIRMAWQSHADIAVVQAQDLLGLGNEARMNLPGFMGSNWRWRLKDAELTSDMAKRLKKMSIIFER